MPPRRLSRYTFTTASRNADGDLLLNGEEPFRYVDLPDNVRHVVQDGDTLFALAGRYFSGITRAAGLWWVIADFQPDPIHDPTLRLAAGRVLFVPSVRTVNELVFSERRRKTG